MTSVFAQKKDSTFFTGVIKGILKDSVRNAAVPSATVAVYGIPDQKLLSYQVSDDGGGFNLKLLPTGKALKLIITCIGFEPHYQVITIPSKKSTMVLEQINLKEKVDTLEEVSIAYLPPVRVKGDTIEFNADAFKLDTNAVVDDLLRKLPGVVIWSDGLITINGAKVSAVLVEGKPFFGGDPKVALENLPKNIVDKIQAYKEDLSDPMNEAMKLNVKLKENKNKGYFGKIGGGYGSGKRFAFDGAVNYFDSKNEFSLVGAKNNLNKIAFDQSALLKESTYKSLDQNAGYQADFNRNGLNDFSAGGFHYKYAPKKETSFISDYFYSNLQSDTKSEIVRESLLSGNAVLNEDKENESIQNGYKHAIVNTFQSITGKGSFFLNQKLEKSKSDDLFNQSNIINNTLLDLSSFNELVQRSQYQGSTFSIGSKYANLDSKTEPNVDKIKFDVGYEYYNKTGNSEIEKNTTQFISTSSKEISFRRNFKSILKDEGHNLSISLDNFLKKALTNFDFFDLKVANTTSLQFRRENTVVNDFDAMSMVSKENNYLTNSDRLRNLSNVTGIFLSKLYRSEFTNRYRKIFSITIGVENEINNQQNNAKNELRNLEKSYNYVFPDATISYSKNRFSKATNVFKVEYKTSADYPTLNQLAALVDSSNTYAIYRGNIALKPEYISTFGFSYDHTSNAMKRPFLYTIRFEYSLIKNQITDSTYFDSSGRGIYIPTNVNLGKSASFDGLMKKSLKFREHLLEGIIKSNINRNQVPVYINSEVVENVNLRFINSLNLDYTYKSIYRISLFSGYNVFLNKQTSIRVRENKVSDFRFGGSMSYDYANKLKISSNIRMSKSKINNSSAVTSCIWNADLSARFLKNKTAEIKFSAMDLLRQNNRLSIQQDLNSISQVRNNGLEHFFLVTLSYYPRNFGTKNK